jgi:hypothetical protein
LKPGTLYLVARWRSIQYPQGIINDIAIPETATGVTLGGGGAKRLEIQMAGSRTTRVQSDQAPARSFARVAAA